MKRFDLSLYLVLDPVLCEPLGMLETARMAVAAGATMVQLRDKNADTGQMIRVGRALKAALACTEARLIVNDDVEAAIAIDADGIHVGQDDLDMRLVRDRVGTEMILGISVETPQLARDVDATIADYVGAGPVFPTGTKPGHKPAIGFDGLAEIVRATPLPVVAIGGLKTGHAAPVFAAGARGMAVVSAICGRADPRHATLSLLEDIRKAGA